MLEIKVNDEIRDVQTDLGKGLSLIQWVYVILGVVLGTAVGFGLYYTTALPLTAVAYILVLFVVPFGLMAFLTWHELTPVAVVKLAVTRFFDPRVKTYMHENEEYIEYLSRETTKPNKKKRKEKGNE